MAVGKRIALTCCALLALTLLLGGIALYHLRQISSAIVALSVDALPGTREIGLIDAHVKGLDREIVRFTSGLADMEKVQAALQLLNDTMGRYDKTITQPRDRELFDKLISLRKEYDATWAQISAGHRAQKPARKNLESVLAGQFDAVNKAVADLVALNRDFGTLQATLATESAQSSMWWSWALLALSLMVGTGLGTAVVRSLNRDLNRTAASLNDAAIQLAGAAGQVAGSSQSLAQGSSQQAASLEETSASTEEINSMSRKNSENSRVAAELVTQSRAEFVKTNHALDLLVAAMADINTQSDKISKIIKVIDEIAFQTNILALNAAVEAARAGEAGMGFAVVADEVRSLAQRCAQAAKDTSAMIEESIAKSSQGKTKVDQVAAAIRSITAESAKVKELVDEVSASSQEQARGVAEIGKALTQMEQVTQRTAASAEEGAAAAEELSAQSSALKELVQQLNVLVGASAQTATAPLAPARATRPSPAPASTSAVALAGPPKEGEKDPFPMDDFKEF